MSPTTIIHISAGAVALGGGYVAILAGKRPGLHTKAGTVFVRAMLVLGVAATLLAVPRGKYATALGGPLVVYLVVTAVMTMREPTKRSRHASWALAAVGLAVGLTFMFFGVSTLNSPSGTMDGGVPAPPIFLNGIVALLAAFGDLRVLSTAPLRGSARTRRHLWRMCFALFIASGSFFLGQAKVIPRPLRITPLLAGIAVFPLLAMPFYLWRYRRRFGPARRDQPA